ncbi:NYN domain [Corynebacterium mustelae]|uniref:NYN domain n=1 Tax=Corynebacterium mustelae TaxID=571915 RepID=A0A0G3GU64_9CORY|nr:NYN domain-containing protein [Corynebacterium mustelae]AKK04681.1 NYN domain [Corynebacterium mustelae]
MVTRVGVYFDGFNVYYGGRNLFKDSPLQWKWYSPRGLAEYVVDFVRKAPFYSSAQRIGEVWDSIELERIVFCSARISEDRDRQAMLDQLQFFNAIQHGGYVDDLVLGHYVSRVKYAPLARFGANKRPEIYHPEWPIMVQDTTGKYQNDAVYLVSYFHNEEKGSDVNVATHLMHDAYESRIDAAIIFSNDSDLSLPISFVRSKIPVGIVNPQGGTPHRSLIEKASTENGDWHCYLNQNAFVQSQMPPSVGKSKIPNAWKGI